ncbi:ADP-ribosylglycohydrolase family protein [Paenibacillus sp. BSR1-1]|uniref:ADP-ribosylglycohydrolase family protein n=1 Tax=Paenibacillus sp. BSR1-1 TaxID=3020845 RepID=UPI0025B0F554|nr:ADP-ribosylglycohydrolase family protein [Paenibacillus sp. BSR1-1]MDN3015524.1 ADP-ribosylglycohydrolase family protein [Paenibacillus sp. BSR1-1]
MKRTQEFFRGCLIGGAIGDALGWPVEFNKHDQIVQQYGPNGIQDLQLVSSGKAQITDDTQMTLFTAEGILRAETRGIRKGICHPPSVVFFAYQRWLLTQGYPRIDDYEWIYDGWLLGVKELHARRAPGNSCLSALLNRKHGTIEEPINNSKGCGGVMRVVPIGLFCLKERAFDMAADCAALTHGHPSGYLSAGALASIVASIIEGADILTAVKQSIMELKTKEHHEECTRILEKALDLVVKSDLSDYEAISQLGEGWVGEEALAVSVYCALKYNSDFKKAIVAAVNHNGDSDSTGAITGNILGAYLGLNKIPADWVEKVELNDIIIQVADDLLTGHQETDEWWNRYPGY